MIEDLDMVVRHYGPRYHTDDNGRVMFIEQKHPPFWIQGAQVMTFRHLHRMLRRGDPERKGYIGYYVLQIAFDENEQPIFPVCVNRKNTLDEIQFKKWMTGTVVLPSLWD